MKHSLIFLLTLCLLVACSSDDEGTYPNIVTHFADGKTNAEGTMRQLVLDDGSTYNIRNLVTGLQPNTTYRVVCDYVPDGNQATVYQLQRAYQLCDSTAILLCDPTNVRSVWKAGKHINLHLAPLTQGGKHYWGIGVDSITASHVYLHLHHNQLADPASYTTDVYASLHTDSIHGLHTGDSVTLRIKTYKGESTWKFKN